MAIANELVTNEIKNAAGTEVEFTRISSKDRASEFKCKTEVPSQPYRLLINHQEIGTGMKKRRLSRIKFSKVSLSGVDSVTPIESSVNLALTFPVGGSLDSTVVKDLLANMMSFVATTGAATTVLFDGSGTGAKVLVDGEV